jgi:hypothetical protein
MATSSPLSEAQHLDSFCNLTAATGDFLERGSRSDPNSSVAEVLSADKALGDLATEACTMIDGLYLPKRIDGFVSATEEVRNSGRTALVPVAPSESFRGRKMSLTMWDDQSYRSHLRSLLRSEIPQGLPFDFMHGVSQLHHTLMREGSRERFHLNGHQVNVAAYEAPTLVIGSRYLRAATKPALLANLRAPIKDVVGAAHLVHSAVEAADLRRQPLRHLTGGEQSRVRIRRLLRAYYVENRFIEEVEGTDFAASTTAGIVEAARKFRTPPKEQDQFVLSGSLIQHLSKLGVL